MKLLDDKIIIITGGAGLLGREFVKAVVSNGGKAVVADIDQGAVQKNINNMKSNFIHLDITSTDSVVSMFKSVRDKYGKIDAVVNNAYPRNNNYGRKFEHVAYQDFCENVSMHLGGYFLVSQQASLFFKKQGGGNVVNISSVYGVVAPRFDIYKETKMTMPVEYAAVKSAVIHLTKYMAKYFKGFNIRFNCISPGGIFDSQPETFVQSYKGYSANKGMLDKTDVSGALVYLLSDMSKSVNGQNIIVDDGWSL